MGSNGPTITNEGLRMSSPTRAHAVWLCGQVEAELARIGGYELLADARTEAEWYAALYVSWDQTGPEPLERLRARLKILTQRLEPARGDHGELA